MAGTLFIPSAGGAPQATFDLARDLEPVPFIYWLPDGQALTFAAARDGISNIWMQPLTGGEVKKLTDLNIEGGLQFDWSPDGKQAVFSRRVRKPDLVLLKNFVPGET